MVISIFVGSRNLGNFDPALIAYLFGCIFACFGVVYATPSGCNVRPPGGILCAGGSLALGLRIALPSLPAGYTLMAVWPERTFSFLHVVFISGFSLLTFLVASRVILGHGGRSHLFTAPLLSIRLLTALLVVAMLTRVTADGMPAIRMTHYAYAAVAGMAGVLVWAVAILPGVRKPDA